MAKETKTFSNAVKIWLLIGVVMVFCQVVIGGITRLTDSGLSITEWAVIQGTIPPLNAEQWEVARQEYMEHAIGQVKMKWSGAMYPDGIPMNDFKFIYFWEYFHRLWARTMGFVFLIPFLIFWRRKMLSKPLMVMLGKVVALTMLVAVFGWIMVKSGLDTPEFAWVNGYKLTIHLSLATIVFGYLWWVALHVVQPVATDEHNKRLRTFAWRITIIICLQIVLGGLMAGIKAGLVFNHFPHMEVSSTDGSWVWIADVLKDYSKWTWENMRAYNSKEGAGFAAALIQLLHRGTAYLLCILIPIFYLYVRRIHQSPQLARGSQLLLFILIAQITLGILTLLNGIGQIPLLLGVLHQAGGLLLLAAMLYVNYQFGKGGEHILRTTEVKKDLVLD
ncbi:MULTISPECIES: COX15/CtaA family protein [unclassified Aureispira]|uniref:COX15/CtaA family protein n=1 Tax=unclassified Aureispira TaxID=2649989 RepID=UPI0006989EDB|nr:MULTISPECIES: COX15/CtaA family protein [unclassified Aureispira]WMX15045.1 COX15/CtaA family protein [Aureispira sp. CCB-E]